MTALFTVCGILGALAYLTAYVLLQRGQLRPESAAYALLNAAAAALTLSSLFAAFNPAALLCNVAWLAISVMGLRKAIRRRRPPPIV